MSELLKYLFDICGIDKSPDVTPEEALRLIRQTLAPIKARLIDDAVDEAIAANKLWPKERDWAWDLAAKDFVSFKTFIRLRQPISALAMRADRATCRRNRIIIPEALQASINKQMGIDPAVFAKYNGEASG